MMERFSTLLNRKLMVPSQRANYMAVDTDYLCQILRPVISQIDVDEEWYRNKYPDVQAAISEGKVSTILEHYALYGYYEHRIPYKIEVDEKWYISEYEDIGKAVEAGIFESGQTHFEECGYREGRIPYPHFRLRLRNDQGMTPSESPLTVG